MKIAYLDCTNGVAGDMFLGALIDAGLPLEKLKAALATLPLAGYTLRTERARRGGIAGTHVIVDVEAAQPARHLSDLLEIVDRSTLPPVVRAKASAAFRRLAEAEGAVHGESPESVHFHEVGAVDSLVDIIGALAGVHLLGIEKCFASPLHLGRGTVSTAHGVLPVPAPATAALAKGLAVVVNASEGEFTTPTGALLVATLAGSDETPPPFRLEATGTGLGTRETPGRPNIFRVLLGEATPAEARGAARRPVVVLETTVDDMTPEWLAPLPERLLAIGALDCTLEPVLLKKGRPGHRIVVIARPEKSGDLAEALFRETSTLGVRIRTEERLELPRGLVAVSTRFGAIRVKVARLPDGSTRAHPEFEDCRRAAEAAGATAAEVADEARARWVEAGRPLGSDT